MSSRDDNQLLGKEVDLDTLKSNCGNKTMDGDKILNPCGSIANSLFNDVLTLIPPSFNESLRLENMELHGNMTYLNLRIQTHMEILNTSGCTALGFVMS